MQIRTREGERVKERAHVAECKIWTAMEGDIERERGIQR